MATNLQQFIEISGAKEHNLNNISLKLPKGKFIVFTGLSGSGKSSLAFDTIYVEGQRRYLESLPNYTRQFLHNLPKPSVDKIAGLSPTIAIDQKSKGFNPRSTVGTVTEIYDYLRVFFARLGIVYCPNGHGVISASTFHDIEEDVKKFPTGTKIIILSPFSKTFTGEKINLFDTLKKEGYARLRIDNKFYQIDEAKFLNKETKYVVDIVVSRLIISDKSEFSTLLNDSMEAASEYSNGFVVILNLDTGKEKLYSLHPACSQCNFSIPKLDPALFSFNSPRGACSNCKGMGTILEPDPEKLIANANLSISAGAIPYLGQSQSTNYQLYRALCFHEKISIDTPINQIPSAKLKPLFYGSSSRIKYQIVSPSGHVHQFFDYIEGIVDQVRRRFFQTTSSTNRNFYHTYMSETVCRTCKGTRLGEWAKHIKIQQKTISQLCRLSINDLYKFIIGLSFTKINEKIATPLLKELSSRLSFLIDVGLNYLNLERKSNTLSGGESQRIRLASQIGLGLSGIVYVLDEPSIGLHQKDNQKLITTLERLRDDNNTLIVVEHDEETMHAADFLVDFGPGGGVEGGNIIVSGSPKKIIGCKKSLTGQFLAKKLVLKRPNLLTSHAKNVVKIIGAKARNLKNANFCLYTNRLTCVAGVSGSGKSTLVHDVIATSLKRLLQRKSHNTKLCKQIDNYHHFKNVIDITQDPIGRTPRSNPATYVGFFTDIRELFASTPQAKILNYSMSRFSFNVAGGRCEHCWGEGEIKIQMHFLSDVYVVCPKCKGQRFNPQTLKIKYKNKTIYDVLQLSVNEAVIFFENQPKISNQLNLLQDVGLGYLKLGQPAPHLSGGEAQRIKLSKYLKKRHDNNNLFILDEPTTGLHIADIQKLLNVIFKIMNNQNTFLVIEHNIDFLRCCDFIWDLGPKGGDLGGYLLYDGPLKNIKTSHKSITAKYI